jgi:hypothetical protein
MKITLHLNLKKSADLEIARKVMHDRISELEQIITPEIESKAPKNSKPIKAQKITPEVSIKNDKEPVQPVEITIEDVREELAKVVMVHKESCKKKLESLSASSVSNLDSNKYGEFYDFLKSLQQK